MAKKQIRIEIKPGGEAIIAVSGVKGKACKDLTRQMEEALGTVVSVKETPEMQERPLMVGMQNTQSN